jgi:hypothetical protein
MLPSASTFNSLICRLGTEEYHTMPDDCRVWANVVELKPYILGASPSTLASTSAKHAVDGKHDKAAASSDLLLETPFILPKWI